MKNLIIIFILAFCATIVNAQVKVLGKIEPNGPTDTYPTHVDSLGRGGFVAVKTWQERNNIPLPRRKAGMMVSVKSATVDSLYRLGVGLTNADWMPYTATVDVSDKASLTTDNHFQGIQNFDSGAYSMAGFWTDGNFEAEGNLQTKTGIFLSTDYASANSWASIAIDPALPPNTNIDIKMPLSSGRLALTSDLSSKANLAGGNTFTGIQKLDGNDSYLLVRGTEAVSFVSAGQIVSQNISDGGMFLAQPGLIQVFSEDGSYIEINPKDRTIGTLSYVLDLPYKSGTLATTNDIPKILSLTASGDGVTGTFQIAHGLSYTPTMISVTANSKDAAVNDLLETSLGNWAYADATYVYVVASKPDGGPGGVVPVSGVNNLKWTILVK